MMDADKRRALAEAKAKVAEIEARKVLTRAEALAVLCRQAGGIACGCGCGEPLDPLNEGVVDEHLRALGLLGGNELDNRAWFRKPCARRKTDAEDTPRMAKAKRQAKCVGPREPPAHPIPQHVQPWPPKGSRKLPSRPFPGRNRKVEP